MISTRSLLVLSLVLALTAGLCASARAAGPGQWLAQRRQALAARTNQQLLDAGAEPGPVAGKHRRITRQRIYTDAYVHNSRNQALDVIDDEYEGLERRVNRAAVNAHRVNRNVAHGRHLATVQRRQLRRGARGTGVIVDTQECSSVTSDF